MKEILRKRVRAASGTVAQYNALREALQHLILKILDDRGLFRQMAFVGGTALRVLFDLQRFSEDLDFSLLKPLDVRFDFSALVRDLQRQLAIYELPVDTKVKTAGTVRNVFLRFRDVLQEFGIVQRRGQKLTIKLEVDTNPPLHARIASTLVQKEFLFHVVHHDLPTLFAGKLLAFLYRNYVKGRDVYDLIWFLTNKTAVNQSCFHSGLAQATGHEIRWSRNELVANLLAKIDATNMATVANDVRPFLDDSTEVRFFVPRLIKDLVRQIRHTEE